MIFGLRTDTPTAELYLYTADGRLVANQEWNADRELARSLLRHIHKFLNKNKLTVHGLTGLFVFEGPGSFTGLRIGITVMNTLAYSLQIPIVGARGEEWKEIATEDLRASVAVQVVLPFYGADARVTSSKK